MAAMRAPRRHTAAPTSGRRPAFRNDRCSRARARRWRRFAARESTRFERRDAISRGRSLARNPLASVAKGSSAPSESHGAAAAARDGYRSPARPVCRGIADPERSKRAAFRARWSRADPPDLRARDDAVGPGGIRTLDLLFTRQAL
ncbi:PREDICTED: uncharacterized protein LOC105564942 isoform X2 [Vollenhovia emeryi]|uniref:uncharacterized protein LOC105564942 isoform X2 n=1 Tax=Vollenhovia emeryi TaxID=411798 RepID=UPI0005F55C66|nr:PREDICTED: uncharacterized protein LOC105564942 isoform X2 [Vollenhovia emeryi]